MRRKIMAMIVALASMGIVLTGCGVSQEAKDVQAMIDQMPETYSVEINDDIANARTAFDALNENDKKNVETKRLDDLETSEKAYNEELAGKINTSIEKIAISDETSAKMNKAKQDIEKVMKEIEKLPASANDLVNYDALLKKVQSLSDGYAVVMDDANDILIMVDIYENLDLINTAYSNSSKYGYACDISSDISSLSNRWSSKKGSINKSVEELKEACLYKESWEVTVAALNVITDASSLSTSINNYYDPFLSNTFSTLFDDCAAWEKIIKEKMGK